ncbi:MAG: extracellular solute-binding protein [Spirochaetales bacterium]|nr:extracellular solute-binding protein [Spirochaetales bacterium]
MKRILALGLCFFVVMTSLFANGENERKNVTVSGPGEFPLVDEKVTFTVFAGTESWVEDLNENWFTKYIEDHLNVKLVFEQSNPKDAPEIVNLKLATGANMPDIFMGWGVTPDAAKIYGERGTFLALDEYIEKQGVNIKEFFEYDPTVPSQLRAMDGKIYGLPQFNECFHCNYSQRMLINKTWLDNLGLELPTTTEEFYQVLKAFKEQDANGNGDPHDEIPLTQIAKHAWNSRLDGYLMNPFTFSPYGHISQTKLYIEDDVVQTSITKEGFREGLKYANKLYKEDLIFKEAFTVSASQVKSLIEHPDGNLIGAVPSGTLSQVCDLTSKNERYNDFVYLAPLKGPTGLQQTIAYYTPANPSNFIITENCEYPEVAFKLADFLMALGHNPDGTYNEEKLLQKMISKGEPEVDWSIDSSDFHSFLSDESWYKIILSYGVSQNKYWGSGTPGVESNFFRLSNAVGAADGFDQEQVLFDAAHSYEPYGKPYAIPPINFTEDELALRNDLHETFRLWEAESYANFVTGNMDPNSDEDWNAYLEQVKDLGMDQLIEVIQMGYDRQYK